MLIRGVLAKERIYNNWSKLVRGLEKLNPGQLTLNSNLQQLNVNQIVNKLSQKNDKVRLLNI